jgi:hypothetical protein
MWTEDPTPLGRLVCRALPDTSARRRASLRWSRVLLELTRQRTLTGASSAGLDASAQMRQRPLPHMPRRCATRGRCAQAPRRPPRSARKATSVGKGPGRQRNAQRVPTAQRPADSAVTNAQLLLLASTPESEPPCCDSGSRLSASSVTSVRPAPTPASSRHAQLAGIRTRTTSTTPPAALFNGTASSAPPELTARVPHSGQ